ncbi:diguanylate cyclase [Amycolatopsis antarctica]|uniref:Diguanylate cyclase n=1 Tax=Amycolatopsis antarctica TaxID=1854586 RepID=A0A263D498_9PSEU|nr:diguanylate cyclase [Amycolatopsis antarctica]OZM72286.1 diguanylate cyclase [Amycolatopsis antarctica]
MWIGYLIGGVAAVCAYYTSVLADAPPVVRVTLYCLVSASAAIAVLCGCLRNRPRSPLPWILIGLSQVVYAVADCYFYIAHFVLDITTFPALADIFYLGHYPLVVTGLVVFIRRRSPGGDLPALLDAALLAVVTATMSWLYLIAPQAQADSPTLVKIVSVAYPVMDLMMFAVALRLILGSGSRPLPFFLLSANLLLFFAADSTYVLQQLNGTYGAGNFLDAIWLFGNLALGASALHPTMGLVGTPRPPDYDPGPGGYRIVALCAASLIAPAILLVQHFQGDHADIPVIAIACGVLFLLTIARMAVLVAHQRQIAITDALTGLHTRRFLETRLPAAMHECDRSGGSLALLIADVDHFKSVNDRFGHPVGDRVLIEIARRLRAVTRENDLLARYGGEEFAVLVRGTVGDDAAVIGERLRRRVAETPIALPDGRHVDVTISVGTSSYPLHGTTSAELVTAADRALYAAKEQGRDQIVLGDDPVVASTTGHRHAPVLLDLDALATEVDGWLSAHEHSSAVGAWAGLVAEHLGHSPATVRRCEIAGRLHDIGKAMISADIWSSREKLTDQEWRRIRRHPDYGWRMLRGVPGQEDVAVIVRQHHERLDGRGYPDGLRGAEIRAEARIVTVCDCWAAMLAERVYHAPLTEEQARAELLAGRGTQYDPDVVDAFLTLWDNGILGPLPRLRSRT